MKATRCFTLILLTSFTLTFTINSFAQTGQPELRLVNFIPGDRLAQPALETVMRKVLKDAQEFFASEMARHGFGPKTFRLGTDVTGKIAVARVRGRFRTTDYLHGRDPINEVYRQFHRGAPVFIILEDGGESPTDEYRGQCGLNGPIRNNLSAGGHAAIYSSCIDFSLVLRGLGHTFGLANDWRDEAYIMSGGFATNGLSRCAAEWLNVHPAFNPAKSAFNSSVTVEMHSPNLASPPNAIRLQFTINDPNGLHQVQLRGETNLFSGNFGLIACEPIDGDTRRTVEFIVNASEKMDQVQVVVMDIHGNFHESSHIIDISDLISQGEVVNVADANLAASLRETLQLNRNSEITQLALLGLTKLSIQNQKITDLTGLEHAKNLKYLTLVNTEISDITVLPQLPNLKEVDLAFNQIHDIKPLAGLTNLRTLLLSENKISDTTPLARLVNLKVLNLEGNPIKNRTPLFALLENNPEVEIYLKWGGTALPVTLSFFRAESTKTGVVIKWITESEVDNAGFYIYRSETKAGDFKVINPRLVQGAGTTSERNTYTWNDATAKPDVTYYYRIEDVSHTGDRKQLATVRMRGNISAAAKFTTTWANLKSKK
ncbi:MAG: leucine-rich repeat domain-containing protein [Candidatus Poribacteria bacterium]|nr:leucine-rich repeat domain-containing protein [Candidatus Poribacteria bacterium]